MLRRITLTLAATAAIYAAGALAPPAPAHAAYTLAPGSLHDPATVWALNAADAYWQRGPDCPQGITVTTYDGAYPPTSGPESGLPGAAVAAAVDCRITLNRAWWWPAWDGTDSTGLTWRESYCQIEVHEYGHLVLGPLYFANVNPGDPSHSPDPTSIMYASPSVLPPGCARPTALRGHVQRRGVARRHHHRKAA